MSEISSTASAAQDDGVADTLVAPTPAALVQPDDGSLIIESLDLEGRGIARRDGKVIFVEGALPGERVFVEVTRRKPSYEKAKAVRWVRESSLRVRPKCAAFGVCGGCAMQHLEPSAQVAVKQRALEDSLWHLARLKPQTVLPPLSGQPWGYRHRARMTVRVVAKKGGALVGFHERGSSYVADMQQCEIMPPAISAMLMPLRGLVDKLSIAQRLPQIEVAVGDHKTVLVMRVLEPPSAADRGLMQAFARQHGVSIWLQPKGPDSIVPLEAGEDPLPLDYLLPEFDIRMPFAPTEFTQVNFAINRSMVSRAVRLLDPQPQDRVLDLFCGLGNFTLPLARRAGEVIGIEGSPALVRRAEQNAVVNGLQGKVRYGCANLFELTADGMAEFGAIDRILIDPPREGALAVVRALAERAKLGLAPALKRIVYVSCNPATLARDAAILVHEGGFVLKAAGAINMFPHTAHVESIAVFEPGPAEAASA